MTAAMPSAFSVPISTPGRPGHRRSYTTNSGPGAFAALNGLPRRRQQKKTMFSLNDDGDDSQDDIHDDEEVLGNIPPSLRLNPNNSFRLSISTANDDDDDATPLRTKQPSQTEATASVPFPRSSPLSTLPTIPFPPAELAPHPPSRPSVTRTTSSPIFLSNGKPLKSSLKSSSSSPHIPLSPQHQPANHQRARSAPSTPQLESQPVPKNVHFPTNEQGGLATVRVFNRSAKPASLSRQSGEDTETETEGELSTGSNSGFIRGPSAVLPFPRSPLSQHDRNLRYEIDTNESSPIPAKERAPYTNVYLEALAYTHRSQSGNPQGLTGTLLVRNIAYEKQVAVRFTLDDWQTTSEVSARHVASLSSLPASFVTEKPLSYGDIAAMTSYGISDTSNPQWDRFGFTIKLEDYAAKLSHRTMFLVARYIANTTTGPVETWDNNLGKNYKIAFKEASIPASSSSSSSGPQRGRVFAMSSPPSFSPATTSTTTATPVATTQPRHSQLVAQTTLLRLKKLNLCNYAAPSSKPVPPTASTTTPTTTDPESGPEASPDVTTDSSGGSVVLGLQGQGQDKNGSERVGPSPVTEMQRFPAHAGSSPLTTAVVGGGSNGNVDRERTPSPTMRDSAGREYKFPGSLSASTSSSSSSSASIPLLSFSSSSSSSAESTPSMGGSSPQMPTTNLHTAALLTPMSAIDIHRPSILEPSDMGTSPPFSMMADLAPSLAKRRDQHRLHSLSVIAPPTSQTSEEKRGGEEGLQHWTLAALALQNDVNLHSQEEVKKVLAGIREKSTSSPVRRVSPTNSGRSSPVKSPVKSSGGRMSPPVLNKNSETSSTVVSPQPRTASDSGYSNTTTNWSKAGSGWNRVTSTSRSHPRASPIYFDTSSSASSDTLTGLSSSTATPTPSTPTVSSASTSTMTSTSSANHQDSVYQAFVKHWCFAQGPPTGRSGGRYDHGEKGEGGGGIGVAAEGGLVV